MAALDQYPNKEHQWLVRLKEAGYRLTAPRRVVVEVVARSQYLMTPQTIFDCARQQYPQIGLVTVYRTLEKLEALHLIQRIHDVNSCQAFIANQEGHKHPLICQKCGRVEYFSGDSDAMQTLSHHVADESGYVVRTHWLQFFGLCADCRGG